MLSSDWFLAVSYTHLDVYKRQGQLKPPYKRTAFFDFYCSGFCIRWHNVVRGRLKIRIIYRTHHAVSLQKTYFHVDKCVSFGCLNETEVTIDLSGIMKQAFSATEAYIRSV